MKRAIALLFPLLLTACENRPSSENVRIEADSLSNAVSVDDPDKPKPSKPIDEMNKTEREAYKDELAKHGYYDCCVKPTCNMCLFDEGEACPCAKLLKKGDGVCGECYKGWHKGKGAIKGIDPEKVKSM